MIAKPYISGHYPDDLPSDSEPKDPEGKVYDGFNELKPTGRYMEATVERNYDNPAFEEWAEKQPMRHPNGLGVSDTVIPGDPPYVFTEDPEDKHREILDSAGLDDNFVYHGVDQHTLVNVLRTELDILNDQDFQDRDIETIKTWFNRRINQIDNEIKLEKRIRR